MRGLLSWYRARARREQWLLLAMLALALPVLLWLAVWRPLDQALDAAILRHAEAVQRQGRVAAAAEALKSVRRPAETPVGDLAAYVGQSAGRSGLSLASAAAQGPDRATVAIAAGDPRAMAGWLRGLEQQGIVVQQLRMTSTNQGTVALSATLSRPGR